MAILIFVARVVLISAIVFLGLYAIRHYMLALYRLSLTEPRDTTELAGFFAPTVSVIVPMHNEEAVAADVLQALIDCDYDWNKLEIIAVNDRSTDQTGAIVSKFAAQYPIVKAIHRHSGNGGKGAALQAATEEATGEILLVFDADYYPGRSLLKQLVAPFCDPQVGAVMGRVVPHNVSSSLLAALLELERTAGYQISQQARHNLSLVPQYGGTVGGVRASILKAVGGWNPKSLTEDTELTFHLLSRGFKVAYVNRAECYEEAPESWPIRKRQISRWAAGHTHCLHRFLFTVLRSRGLSAAEKIDAVFVLACYWTAPALVIGWLASLILLFIPEAHKSISLVVAAVLIGYQLFGNNAAFFEQGFGAFLDGNRRRVLLMPFSLFNFFSSTGAIFTALLWYYWGRLTFPDNNHWHKTRRFRQNNNLDGNGVFRNGHDQPLQIRTPDGLYLSDFRRLP